MHAEQLFVHGIAKLCDLVNNFQLTSGLITFLCLFNSSLRSCGDKGTFLLLTIRICISKILLQTTLHVLILLSECDNDLNIFACGTNVFYAQPPLTIVKGLTIHSSVHHTLRYFVCLINSPTVFNGSFSNLVGAPVAQWVKRWPTDLADRVRSSHEVKSSQP